jgi:N-acetylglucosamine-6-phosphate deacetylase
MDGTVEAFVGAGRMLLEHGVTSVLPTSLTSTDEALDQTLVSFRQAQQELGRLPRFLGVHHEGPYLALSQKGAQPERFLKLPEQSHIVQFLSVQKVPSFVGRMLLSYRVLWIWPTIWLTRV